ncbi:MAG: patatin-like phospholipase family protein, partial [Ruminococcus sp.]|nr:patatin-like phospholipase family protein [Ruminococcus sp.]
MKTGLVLEGGAMRGLFTAGVLDVLMENEITFDGATGVSAGACFGCNCKSGQNGRVIRYNLRFCRDKHYCSIWSLIFTGNMFGAEFCYHTIPDKLDLFDYKTFRENPMDFFVVCTD